MMANIGIASGEGIATNLSDDIGFTGVFRLLALLNLLLIPLLFLVFRRFYTKSAAATKAHTPVDPLAI